MSMADALKGVFDSNDKVFDRVKHNGLIMLDTVITALTIIHDYEESGAKNHKATLKKVGDVLRESAYKLEMKTD